VIPSRFFRAPAFVIRTPNPRGHAASSLPHGSLARARQSLAREISA
jgi:hypothetical protein